MLTQSAPFSFVHANLEVSDGVVDAGVVVTRRDDGAVVPVVLVGAALWQRCFGGYWYAQTRRAEFKAFVVAAYQTHPLQLQPTSLSRVEQVILGLIRS